MSSNDSMSSSRLSQFGLYRTIDARTEEFLKLSRKRQIRQGCVCATVSTAITVTVVVSVLFLYGYGIGASTNPDLRRPSWLDLMNDTSDAMLFRDRLKSNIKLDRAAMSLLPVFLDKILEYDTSSPKYETKTDTEYNFQKDIFSGSNVLGKIPNSRLFAIQYKAYPIVYFHSPRNTDNYMKLKKTREYERIMSYIEKMINEKVGYGSNRSVRKQPPVEYHHMTDNILTTPATRKISRNKLKSVVLNSNKYPRLHSAANRKNATLKVNVTKSDEKKKNCKCHKQFGLFINKVIKCFQELSHGTLEQPCNNRTEKTQQNIRLQNITNPIKYKIHTTPKAPSRKPITTTTKVFDQITTSTVIPDEKEHVTDSLLQKMLLLNQSNLKRKEFLTHMPSLFSLNENNKTKNNNLRPHKGDPKSTKVTKLLKKYETKNNNKIYTTPATTSSTTDNKYMTSTTQHTKYEDVFQELLFPEGYVFEVPNSPQKSLKKDSTYLTSPTYYEISPNKSKPQKPIDSQIGLFSRTDDNTKNITTLTHKKQNTPKYPKISPEEYAFERFRQRNNKLLKEIESLEPKSFRDNIRKQSSDKSMIGKLKDLLSIKHIQPHRKNYYKKNSPQLKNTNPFPNFIENVNVQKQLYNENITENNLQDPLSTTTPAVTVLPKTIISTISDLSSVPTQLQKYSHEPQVIETTTPLNSQELKPIKIVQKLERRNIANPEDISLEFEVDKTFTYDNLEIDIRTLSTLSARNASDTINTTPISYINITEIPNNTTILETSTVAMTKSKNQLADNTSNIKDIDITSNDQHTLDPPKTKENYEPFESIIPIGRKSYLEISRGDWKQTEPHVNNDINLIYDTFDEVES